MKQQKTTKSSFPQETYENSANIYKILANAKRLEIIHLLRPGEMGVEEILKRTKLPKSNLSQHLALMRHSGLVKARRDGLNIFYKIVDSSLTEALKLLQDLCKK